MGFFNLFASHKEAAKHHQQYETQFESSMFEKLSQTQKFAMVTMLASLAAAPTNEERRAVAQKMMFTGAELIGITREMMLSYMHSRNNTNAQTVIATLSTITDTDVLEWLIYCGFGIIGVNQNDKACRVFFDWWHQLGYEPEEIDCIVKKLESICNKIR